MSRSKLQAEERRLLDCVESGEFESTLTDERLAELGRVAADTFRKDKRINIRVSSRDLLAIQSRAVEEGIPYQTLVSSIIHKYVSGSLRDVSGNTD
jgi:predicted DNA binding CopG/RHH family protein